jgi:type I restriction enzyme S subunit
MPEKLPKGWVKTTLGDIVEPSRERASPMDYPDLRYVGLEHIEPHSMRLLEYGHAREARSSSVRFWTGDILYGKMRPYLNKVWVAEFEGLCSAEFLVFKKRDAVNNQFLATRLNAEDFVSFANGQVSGERPRVGFEKLSDFQVLLPPLAEQARIVAKLRAAFSSVDRAETAARRAQKRLGRYRSAVLEAAVRGELTRTRRETEKNEKIGRDTGEVLLQRLLVGRRARWEETELHRLHAAAKTPKDDKWKLRYDEPTSAHTTELPDIPAGWAWARLQQLGFVIGGLAKNPRRQGLRLKLPYLRVANVYANELRLHDVETIGVDREEIDKLLLEKGDLLIVEGNGSKEQIGRLAIWDGSIERCVHQNHIIKVRLVDRQLGTWILSWLLSPSGRQYIEKVASSTTGLYTLSITKVGDLPIPLPPSAEQTEISHDVDRRMLAANRLQAALEQQLVRSSITRQSLLREAFTGRLVSQEPNDEPASLLLEGIHAAREAEAQKPKGERMSKSKVELKTAARRNLLVVLKEHGGAMTPEELFRASGHSQESVDQFFAELRTLTSVPAKVAEERKTAERIVLKAIP